MTRCQNYYPNQSCKERDGWVSHTVLIVMCNCVTPEFLERFGVWNLLFHQGQNSMPGLNRSIWKSLCKLSQPCTYCVNLHSNEGGHTHLREQRECKKKMVLLLRFYQRAFQVRSDLSGTLWPWPLWETERGQTVGTACPPSTPSIPVKSLLIPGFQLKILHIQLHLVKHKKLAKYKYYLLTAFSLSTANSHE